MKYDKDTVLDTAMQVIKDEYESFTNNESDNSDYVPRVVRVAESAGTLLSLDGMGQREVRANVNRIIEYGRRLFIQEWMRLIMDEAEQPCEQEAIEEFDRYLRAEQRTISRRKKAAVGSKEGAS